MVEDTLNSIGSLFCEAEQKLSAAVQRLSPRETIAAACTQSRKRAKEALEQSPEQKDVAERIERLRLRLELVRNMKMNWEPFVRRLQQRNKGFRIQQIGAIRELIQFLQDETYRHPAQEQWEGSEENLPGNDLVGHYVHPTGAGKTGLFAMQTALMDVETVVLVPFDALLRQTKNDMVDIGGIAPESIGLIGGGEKDWQGKKVVVSTYAGHRIRMQKDPAYAQWVQQQCKAVICDEVHMALGKATQESIQAVDEVNEYERNGHGEERAAENDVLEHLAEFTPVKSLKIGFTATARLSQKHVQQHFPRLIGRVYHAEMVEAGYLVPYEIIQSDGSVHAGEIGSYITEEQEVKLLRREGIYSKLAGKYADVLATYHATQQANDYPMRGMAFCTSHAECETFQQEAAAYGLRTEIVTGWEAKGKHSQEVIDKAVGKLLSGETDLLITVEKLATGFNRKEIDAVVWARVTSAAKTIQGIGRGSRAHTDERGRRKTKCRVFETNWTLKGNLKKGRKPLRLADALAEQGEEPQRICTMADGSKPQWEDAEQQRERIRTLLTAAFTPETWAKLPSRQRQGKDFAKTGMGLWAIARCFGVDGNPVNYTSALHALGRIIWGEEAYGDPEANERGRIRTLLTESFPPTSWAKLTYKQRRGKDFGCTGMGLTAIATLFGVGGNPADNNSDLHALGRMIWGEAYGDPEEKERECIRTLLMESFSPTSWAKLTYKQRGGKDFAKTGMGLMAIARCFGVEGDPASYTSALHALGRIIWGEEAYGDPEANERGRIRTLLTESFSPETWAKLTSRQRRGKDFGGTGMGLAAIATLFGVEGSPVNYNTSLHALGHAIWGEEAYGDPEENERERIRTRLTIAFTPETWAKLPHKQREGKDFAKTGMGLWAIARCFGVDGNPVGYTSTLHALGRIIWGEAYGDPEEKERECIRTLLMESFSPTSWAKLTYKQRGGDFAGTGMGLKAIATLFGVDGNPVGYTSALHALGRMIWGEAYGDPEEKERECIRTLLMESFSPTSWAKLTCKQRQGKDFGGTGMGLKAIARFFSVEGDPASSTSTLHALGHIIWGDTWPKEL